MKPLQGADKAILDLLTAGRSFDDVVEIGRYKGQWRPSDVCRVANAWLRPAAKPTPARIPPQRPAPRPVASTVPEVQISPLQAAILVEAGTGAPNRRIAAVLGVSVKSVEHNLSRAVRKIADAAGRPSGSNVPCQYAVRAVLGGAVHLVVRDARKALA